jgi:hypothetical protein
MRWAWVLGAALLLPVALPAGGAPRRLPEVRHRRRCEPWLASGSCTLRTAPAHSAPSLTAVACGAPITPLRVWRSPGGRRWLRVQTTTAAGAVRRGWLAA